jgi:tRNA(adenine34) deaminase
MRRYQTDLEGTDAMWDSLTLPWHVCLEEAWSAYYAGAIPIGAAITDAAGTVIARGRNRVFSNTAPDQRPHGHPLAHAEMHAFERLDWDAIDPHDCVLYTTMEPCPLCLGALYMSGLREVRYAARDPYAGSTDLLRATPYLRSKDVCSVGPTCPRLEAILVSFIIEFSLHRAAASRKVSGPSAWETTAPAGVRLGETLHRSGDLRRLRASGSGIASVVDVLAARLGSLRTDTLD